MRIVQISDTHLSRDKSRFLDNWAPLSAWIAGQHPDLVIHTGDVTVGGAGVEAARHFGPDCWVEDIDEGAQHWRLVGFDALLVNSGEPEEAEQLSWLEQVMAEAGERRIAWFLHRPLFLDSPDEGDTGYWSIKPEPRRALMALVRRHRVALVASGHLHKARDFTCEGTRYIWSPPSSFLVGAAQPDMPGDKRLGAVVYEFGDPALTVRIAAV